VEFEALITQQGKQGHGIEDRFFDQREFWRWQVA
jgi:hypothetical protein